MSSILGACSSDANLVRGPTSNRPIQQLASIEREANSGSIYQPGNPSLMVMFQAESKPSHIGDTLKIDISETLSATNKSGTSTSRANKVATKGPGGAKTISSLLNDIINADASASGSDSFEGKGNTENTNKLKGKLAASVINVLPNGNLVVAGEKSIAFNGSTNTLRFSGVVDPADIKTGRTVASADVIDARLEQISTGMVSDTASRGWLQRMLTDSLVVW
ncbi:flagellar basal body L-ring protein FlgH [Uliginosibacterium sp. 31-16]|uniref:flagellar basal body L-ring protein FlgH n=1 Tax=Uliginosibacterium sp. 31-16 TaxID=3068315 RepID=UPI00273F1483|nr:flagellar basal body L-ring protein FlgH [Uliginosibacterium sp. 31-16]MDP5240360.1 flagellar basal body L-ring protein FlgH [Uliginosibacterium sp. 31-16]